MMISERAFRWRIVILLVIVLTWAGFAVARLFYFTTSKQRTVLIEECKQIAWRKGKIPALRGAILDCNELRLAWTELRYELRLLEVPNTESRRKAIQDAIEKNFNVKLEFDTDNMLLIARLNPERLEIADKLVQKFPELSIKKRFIRMTVDYPRVQEYLGRCESDDEGVLYGESGVEMEMNALLSGVPGEFEVMLDKKGNWLLDTTLRNVKPPLPGQDVVLQQSLQELNRDVKYNEQ